MTAPVAPIGWPSEMPEPFGLTRSGEAELRGPRPRLRGKCLVHLEHIDVVDLQAGALQHLAVAGTGPMPMIRGSTPAWRSATSRASGCGRGCSATLRSISTTAAAASLTPEALPAVTVPFLREPGLQLGEALRGGVRPHVLVGRSNTTVPFFDGACHRQDLLREVARSEIAGAARRWHSTASASCSSRETSYFFATFSAVTPMWNAVERIVQRADHHVDGRASPMRWPQRRAGMK